MILYSGHKSDKYEFGKLFYISRHTMDNLLDFEPASENFVKLRLNLNITIWF
jgi:hypothetical protein